MQLGGAAYLTGGTMTCYGCYFTGNSATTSANDVYINSASLSTSDCENGGGSYGELSTNTGTYYNYNCGALLPTPTPTLQPTAQPTLQPTLKPTSAPP